MSQRERERIMGLRDTSAANGVVKAVASPYRPRIQNVGLRVRRFKPYMPSSGTSTGVKCIGHLTEKTGDGAFLGKSIVETGSGLLGADASTNGVVCVPVLCVLVGNKLFVTYAFIFIADHHESQGGRVTSAARFSR
jgi:hypothetical protein